MINKTILFLKLSIYFMFSNTFGLLQYDKKYFSGRWFSKWSSNGWEKVFKCFWSQYFGSQNNSVRWPVSKNIIISGNPNNIYFHPDDMNNFWSAGNYYQCLNEKIYLGKGVHIAPNVGIITSNHDINNLNAHIQGKKVIIKDNSWIGMNSVILPGVELGEKTIVGAGSIVTKSFQKGNVIIAGNPAKIIKEINEN